VLHVLGARWVWDRMVEHDPERARACLNSDHIVEKSGRLRTVLDAALDARDVRGVRFLSARGAKFRSPYDSLTHASRICKLGSYEFVWALIGVAPDMMQFRVPNRGVGFCCRKRMAAYKELPAVLLDMAVTRASNGKARKRRGRGNMLIRDFNGENRADALAHAVAYGHRFPRLLLEEIARRGGLSAIADQAWFARHISAEIPGESARMLRWVLTLRKETAPAPERASCSQSPDSRAKASAASASVPAPPES